MSFYKAILKPLLFLMNPERAHAFTFSGLKFMLILPGIRLLFSRLFCIRDPRLERVVAGIRFPNAVGLAAGLDKDAKMVDEFSALGFGFVEIGTVTPLPQPGNPKPRLFRLPEDEALINRMGFNNEGAAAAAARLRRRKSKIIIGGNIGKNKITPNEQAVADYEKCFLALYDVVDYFVVNVSSPNTPGLRELQEKEPLKKLLGKLAELNSMQAGRGRSSNAVRKPIFLKIAPDLTNEQLDEVIEVVNETGIDGIVATNTTVERKGLQTSSVQIEQCGMGGLSGKPLRNRSTEVIRYLHIKSAGKIPIIGVGGIHAPEDALEKLKAGASLVQLYTGFIYEGPALVAKINKALLQSE